MEANRRDALAMIASAISVPPSTAATGRTKVVTLPAESEAIIQRLIAAGHHKNRDDVVKAAMVALMAKYGRTITLLTTITT